MIILQSGALGCNVIGVSLDISESLALNTWDELELQGGQKRRGQEQLWAHQCQVSKHIFLAKYSHP